MDGEVISLRAEEHISSDAEGHHLAWKNLQVFITDAQRSSLDKIRQTIVEALDAMGLAFNRSYVRTVTVEFYLGRK